MYRSVVVHELSDDFSNISVETFERQDLQPDELRIKVKSASVNLPDLLMTAGLYQYKPEVPFTLGMESSGIVIEKEQVLKILKLMMKSLLFLLVLSPKSYVLIK